MNRAEELAAIAKCLADGRSHEDLVRLQLERAYYQGLNDAIAEGVALLNLATAPKARSIVGTVVQAITRRRYLRIKEFAESRSDKTDTGRGVGV